LNYAIFGNSSHPAGYHWINVVLHMANALLLFALARRLLSGHRHAFGIAFFIALLWGVHPALTESVTNVIGRADLLAAAAVLSGFWMYLKGAEAAGWRQFPWLIGLALATAGGVLSKESAVVLPAIIVLYELIRPGEKFPLRPFRWAIVLRGCAASLIAMAAVLGQRALVLAGSLPAEFPFVDNPIAGAGFWTGRLTAFKVLAHYLRVALWPIKLSADYSYAEIPLVSGKLGDWVAWILVAAALSLLPLLYIRSRKAFFFACFGLLNFLPVSNLVFPIGTIMAERLLYLPLIGFVAAVVIAVEAAGWFARLPGAVAVLLVCLLAAGLSARTWMRNRDWQDDLTMATASVRTSPDSFKVHRLLAAALFERDPAHGNIDRVVAEADRSLAILSALPDYLQAPGPWNLAAACHLAKGDLLPEADARRQYQEAARIAQRAIAIEAANRADYDRRHGIQSSVPPGAADGYRILASAYLRLRDGEQALPPAMEARKINPANVEVYGEIADAYLAQRRGEDAAIALAEGMFATGDASLREDLLKLYQSGVDTRGCAVVPGPRGPALNPSCDIVRRDLCAGTTRAHRQDLGRQLQCPN
jgi:protein O-mannosyl-transferase